MILKLKPDPKPFNIQTLNPKCGFTLVEVLVVTVLMGIIAAIATQILILSVRSQIKNEFAKEVKQNGDYALSVMENLIRNSIDATPCNTPGRTITITAPNGSQTTFTCSSLSQISSQSAVRTVNLTGPRVTLSSCTFTVICPATPITPKYVFLNFTVKQLGGNDSDPNSSSSLPFESTIELRNYQ